jgi:hypothetical protein
MENHGTIAAAPTGEAEGLVERSAAAAKALTCTFRLPDGGITAKALSAKGKIYGIRPVFRHWGRRGAVYENIERAGTPSAGWRSSGPLASAAPR